MTTETLFNELLIQLDGNEEAIELIIQFIFDNNNNENIKLATLEQMKQNLAKLEVNDDTSDIKKILELSAITKTINEFNNSLKAEQTFNQTKKIEPTKKRELEESIASELFVPCFKKPNLTPSFDSCCAATSSSSTSTKEEIINALAANISQYKTSLIIGDPSKNVGNEAIFKIPSLKEGDDPLILSECWCKEYLKRSENSTARNSARIYIENTIVDKIVTTVTDDKNKSTILLINLGSDHIGLLVMLSKLYLSGYKKVKVINIDNYDGPARSEHGLLSLRERSRLFQNFLFKAFGTYQYESLIVNNNNDPLVKRKLSSIKSEIAIVFSEDLGLLESWLNHTKRNQLLNDTASFITNKPKHGLYYTQSTIDGGYPLGGKYSLDEFKFNQEEDYNPELQRRRMIP